MGQQSLIYSFVARGTVILAEYTEFTGNFTTIAFACLKKLQKFPASNNKYTFHCDGHTINFLVDKSFFFCVIAVLSIGCQVPMAFLEHIKDEFTKRYEGEKAATAVANSLSKDFGEKMKEQMQFCVDHREEVNIIARMKFHALEVKEVMMENIENVGNQGEKIKLLVNKPANVRPQAHFRHQGTQMRMKLWWLKNMKVKLTVLGFIVVLILIIVLFWIYNSHVCN